MNASGDFMCANTMLDTNCGVSDIIKMRNRPCEELVPRRSKSRKIDMVEIVKSKTKYLEIRVLCVFLACSALYGCLVSSVSNQLNTKGILCHKTEMSEDLINFLDF